VRIQHFTVAGWSFPIASATVGFAAVLSQDKLMYLRGARCLLFLNQTTQDGENSFIFNTCIVLRKSVVNPLQKGIRSAIIFEFFCVAIFLTGRHNRRETIATTNTELLRCRDWFVNLDSPMTALDY
jgi:hypothetical protein